MAHASEGMHWYTRKGEPAYTVKARDGSDRPATLRDARKLGLVPSVTSIIRCAAAPGLERWKLDQMLHAALTLPRGDTEAEAQWIERVWADSKETAKKAAERGTAIHAAIDKHFAGLFVSRDVWPFVEGAKKQLAEWRPGGWNAEFAFAHQLGFGGKVDAHSTLGGFYAVADFKTKEFSEADSLKTWDEHAMQLAAYRHGLGLEKARCAIVYVSTTVPGLARLIEIPEDELQNGWKMFYSLLHYWQAKNKFVSAFNLEAMAA